MTDTRHEWWGQLRHDGVLVTPQLLDEFFPDLATIGQRDYDRLRDAWLAFDAHQAEGEARRAFMDVVLRDLCGLIGWQKGPQVADRFKATSPTGQRLRPDWVLTDASGPDGVLAVVFDDAERIGIGRSKRAYARLVELLRATGIPLGMLTNGRQLRLVHAGPDYAAWAEWDAVTWFDEAEGREQLRGLRTLAGHEQLLDAQDGSGLVAAVQASRHRQGDLAQVLGEQVRQAVEHVIDALDAALTRDPALLRQVHKEPRTGQDIGDQAVLRAIYQASTRLVMRLVVLLYAEARDLLPRSNETYHRSYGVEGLYQQLSAAANHAGGASALADRTTAWPRLLALFRLVHEGSPHQELPIRDYGGTLFRRGDLDAADPVLRALAVLEEHGANDATVLRLLKLLKIGRVKVRRGRSTTWVSGPVNFSDLRTEYIGIIYEGLLDFELKRAPDDDAIVFLNVGRQPALPLARLEAMTAKDFKELLKRLKKDKKKADTPDLDGDADDDDQEEEPEEAIQEKETEEVDQPVGGDDELDEAAEEALIQRVYAWAERAVEDARIVRKTKRKTVSGYGRERQEAARKLIDRIVAPHRLYLATWGGLRKGTGTFYTRPALSVPTTHRTLEPLCYESADGRLTPRAPEEILELKVCDPAMGSGSFLVAALRYLTEALANALVAHGRINRRGDQTIVTLPFGREATGAPHEELLPVPPDDDRFDGLLRTRLARHVVERCIYGVDINPMAVELARLALWIDTLDRDLPFEYLDHKLKVGNSLVGGWIHLGTDYPVQAWERDIRDPRAADQSSWLKKTLQEVVKPEFLELLRSRSAQLRLFEDEQEDPRDLLDRLALELERVHELPRDEKEAAYLRFLRSEAYRQLTSVLDRWCAVWFWPTEPERREPALSPAEWRQPSDRSISLVEELAASHRFFHWEVEFADVFGRRPAGFDAVLGNPPWETIQAESLEFFSRWDPLFRTYSKTDAQRTQERLFEDVEGLEQQWITYQADFRAFVNWVSAMPEPYAVFFGRKKAVLELVDEWEQDRRSRRSTLGDFHLFSHQGSLKLYTYKLFLELAHQVLRKGGAVGFVVPSGIWTDMLATDMRRHFLERSQWEWCYGFENRKGVFPIHRMYKFAPTVIRKGRATDHIKAAFMRHDVTEWERPDPPTICISASDVRRFAPKTLAFLEVRSNRDLELAERIYADHPPLGDVADEWGADYSREINVTDSAKKLTTLGALLRAGLLAEDSDTRDPRVRARLLTAGYLPVYEGKSIWLHTPYYGVQTRFATTDVARKLADEKHWSFPRLVYRDIASSTNQRTLVVAMMPPTVHGHNAPTINGLGERLEPVIALLASLVMDYIIRMKVSTHLTWGFVETLPMPTLREEFLRQSRALVPALNCLGTEFGALREPGPLIERGDRLAARLILDAASADLFGLRVDDLAHIATRFPIYDKDAAELAYPRLALDVYQVFCDQGPRAAAAKAKAASEARRAAGYGFGFDDIYVPHGGWEKANAEAQSILEAG